MKDVKVPIYKLYGEQALWPTPEPVHYETIAARSALYDWEITPHSHDSLLHLVFLNAGQAEMVLETQVMALELPCALMVPPRRIHGFRFSSDVVGEIVTLPQNLLGELLVLSAELRGAFDGFRYLPLGRQADALALMRLHFGQFAREYAGHQPGRLSVLMAVLAQVLVQLARAGAISTDMGPRNRMHGRVERFVELIERHFRDWQPLSFYAQRLGVSTAQLNNSCRREAGRSAQEMIHDRLLLEARRLLAYSDLDVTGIGYALGFRDPAYFSRFFARRQGVSPSVFRLEQAERQRQPAS